MIYGTIAFGLRNGFGMHRKVIGSPEGVSEAPGVYWAYWAIEGEHTSPQGTDAPPSRPPALVGLCVPLRMAHLAQ